MVRPPTIVRKPAHSQTRQRKKAELFCFSVPALIIDEPGRFHRHTEPARMLLAIYTQSLDPLGNRFLSTAVAALPVLTLFWVLVPMHRPAPVAGLAGSIVAVLAAWLVYGMSLPQAGLAFANGASFGLMHVGWTILNAMLLYNITVETGQF